MQFDRPRDIFGVNVFDRRAMKDRLPQEVYNNLLAAMDGGQKLDPNVADMVAASMKEWAISKGATHWTHWFQPRTELTAEKHLSFISSDETGHPIESFKGKQLIQSEPDASSFPSGGIRSTFEARGYSAWDPSSPAFLIMSKKGGTLCIPSVFISYDGTPLDLKTPLLKALEAVESRALKLLKLFGNRGVRWAHVTVGAEQEYFLVDAPLAKKRPDLQFCGRTIFGCPPPKGQQMEDHYFGSIPPRVLSYMEDVERDLYRLGVVIDTRHNEVAPCQFEFAPQLAEANQACDQNQLIMETMRKMARRHDFALLLHEKPFAGLNGSGKHINFSIRDSEGRNLLMPSTNQKKNVQFLTFLSAFLLGFARYGSLLRAAIASPGNMHRLGGNEAPPAILSVFLGSTLSSLLDGFGNGSDGTMPEQAIIDLGLNKLPSILCDNSDRNRTSPIAFTGNKFEFRAPGAPQSIAGPLTMIMAIWAWGIDEVSRMIEARMSAGTGDINDIAMEVIARAAQESKPVRFEGNCYSEEWQREAQRRGLTIAKTTVEALDLYLCPENKELLSNLNILSEREIDAYYEIRMEQYVKTIDIEIGILKSMIWEGILPALSRQMILEGESLSFVPDETAERTTLSAYVGRLASLKTGLMTMSDKLDALHINAGHGEMNGRAQLLTDEGLPLLDSVRALCNAAESLVARDIWPYPTYRDLFQIS
jgi:glutamine synthetase